MNRLLKRHSVADTAAPDEMQHLLVDIYDARSFEVRPAAASFLAKAGYFDLGRSNLSYCFYSTPVSVQFRGDDLVRAQIALNGSSRFSSEAGSTDITGAVIGCPSPASLFQFGAHYEQLVLRIPEEVLAHDVALLTGRRPRDRISFDPTVSADLPPALWLRQLLLSCVASIDLGEGPLPSPILRELDQLLRFGLLYGIPNSASSLLADAGQATAPWQVRRVEDWVQANWRTEITIEKLVEISGASARSVFSTFRRARGITPMEYVKTVRLDGARQMLLQPVPATTVTQVALRCNFLNTSHFARDYKRRFGEQPSETLSRSKSRT